MASGESFLDGQGAVAAGSTNDEDVHIEDGDVLIVFVCVEDSPGLWWS